MSVRKRPWSNCKGDEKSTWVVDYTDTKGTRRLKSFKLKKQADQFAATASVEVREGTHVADRETVTVEAAGKLWITTAEAAALERLTLEAYRARLNLHIGHSSATRSCRRSRSRLCAPSLTKCVRRSALPPW